MVKGQVFLVRAIGLGAVGLSGSAIALFVVRVGVAAEHAIVDYFVQRINEARGPLVVQTVVAQLAEAT